VRALPTLALLAAGCAGSGADAEVDRATRVVDHLVGAASVHPSGEWVAYAEQEDVWLRPIAGPGAPIDVTGVAGRDPFAAPDQPPPAAAAAQAGWEYDPEWSPDGRAMIVVAARDDGDDDDGDDLDRDLWLLDFGSLDWHRLAADHARLTGPGGVDEAGDNGQFWDDCPPPPEGRAEPAAARAERLASCVRRLRPPAYRQLTDDPGAETQPRWVGDRAVVFRSDRGGLWRVDTATAP
jgi:hypothetical protein